MILVQALALLIIKTMNQIIRQWMEQSIRAFFVEHHHHACPNEVDEDAHRKRIQQRTARKQLKTVHNTKGPFPWKIYREKTQERTRSYTTSYQGEEYAKRTIVILYVTTTTFVTTSLLYYASQTIIGWNLGKLTVAIVINHYTAINLDTCLSFSRFSYLYQ
jgi:hypothetical protein